MKKTYITTFLFLMISAFYYGAAAERSKCPRGPIMALNVHPPKSCTPSCHAATTNNTDTLLLDTLSGPVRPETTTGVDDMDYTSGIAAYPTLASNVLHIETTTAGQDMQYTIYSLEGRSMMVGDLPSFPALTTVDIQGLAPAHYVVRIADASHSATFRIIKN